MSRTLTGAMLTAIAKQFTSPVFLIAQDIGGVTLYHSTREQISYGGDIYQATTGAALESLTSDTIEWSLDNSNRAISVQALGGLVSGSAVAVRLYYEGEATDPFEALIDSWQTSGQRVYFSAKSAASRQQRFPNERVQNGVFNHLPPAGTVLKVGGQGIILQPDREL